MRVLTVDGSMRSSGICIGDELQPLLLTKIVTEAGLPVPATLEIIYSEVRAMIRDYFVERLLLESKFVGKNPKTSLELAMVDGAVMLAATHEGIPVHTYTPSEIKKAATTKGNANKALVQLAVVQLYGEHPVVDGRLRPEWIGKGGRNKCDDLADALAIWHVFNAGFEARPA